jgi:hypothetical protein
MTPYPDVVTNRGHVQVPARNGPGRTRRTTFDREKIQAGGTRTGERRRPVGRGDSVRPSWQRVLSAAQPRYRARYVPLLGLGQKPREPFSSAGRRRTHMLLPAHEPSRAVQRRTFLPRV